MGELFGDKLKRIRIERELSQQQLADLLGTSKQVISRYETNQRTPKITVAQEYADKLNVPLNYLIDENLATDSASSQPPLPLAHSTKDERDLAKFLNRTDIEFDGAPLTVEDKDKLRKALEIIFWDAKTENKKTYAKRKTRNKPDSKV